MSESHYAEPYKDNLYDDRANKQTIYRVLWHYLPAPLKENRGGNIFICTFSFDFFVEFLLLLVVPKINRFINK